MVRDALDRYYTPTAQRAAVDVLMRHLPLGPGLELLEPCAGTGNIARELRRHGHRVTTADIDPEVSGLVDIPECDALRHPWAPGSFDGVITNPPYKGAPALVRRLLPVGRIFSAHLLRLSFLEPCADRLDLVGAAPRVEDAGLALVIVMTRMSFTNDGKTDSVTTAWFVWLRGWSGEARLVVEDLRGDERAAQRTLWEVS